MNAPRLYLITHARVDPGTLPLMLDQAAAFCDLACVLFRFATENLANGNGLLRKLASPLQARGVACLVERQNSDLVPRLGFDGVHVEGAETELTFALRAMKPAYIVGAGGLSTRHAAMTAGEAGADYVMFGGPQYIEAQSYILEQIAWWTELFDVPCIGYAQDLAAIEDLTRAGADFVALGDAYFEDPLAAGEALRAAAMLAKRRP